MFALSLARLATAQGEFRPDKSLVNVGEIMFQVPHKVVLPFSNAGNKSLRIIDVHPSCGCVSVTWPEKAVAAGERGEIVATYDAAMLGVFVKEIEVLTSSADEPVYLTFQGKVTTEPSSNRNDDFPIDLDNVRMTTNRIEFDDVNKGDRPVAEIQILNAGRQAYKPQLMHLPSYLTASYEPQVLSGGRVGRILLTLNSNALPDMGLNQTSIYLARYNGDRIGEDNEIAVSAVLLPSFPTLSTTMRTYAPKMRCSESSLKFSAWGSKSKQTGRLVITNEGRTDLEVNRLQVFNRGVSASLSKRRIEPGGKAVLKVTLEKKRLERDKNRPRILLITNDPDCPKQIFEIAD